MKGYLHRMRGYLGEMFPPARHLAVAFATYLATAAFARAAAGSAASVWTPYLALGVWSYFAVPLLLRLMDELKDEDIDRRLFRDRPLPSGRVERRDIHGSMWGVAGLYVAANAGAYQTLAAALVITVWAFLMYRRFFAETTLRASLPITLATHNPIVPMSLAYGFFLFAAEQDLPLSAVPWLPAIGYVAMLWAPFLAWEFSRKIRAPEEEDEYVTYTQLLGARGAVTAVCATQALGVAAATALAGTLPASPLLAVIPAAAWLVNLWAGVRFVRHPTPHTARLRPFAELFLVANLAAVLVAFHGALL